MSLEFYFLCLWLLLTLNRLIYVYKNHILLFFNMSDHLIGKHFLSYCYQYIFYAICLTGLRVPLRRQSYPIYFMSPSRAHSWCLMNVYSIVLLEPSILLPIVLTSVVSAFCILRPIVGSRLALFQFLLPTTICIDLSVIQINNCFINDKGFPRSSVWRGEIFRKGISLWY